VHCMKLIRISRDKHIDAQLINQETYHFENHLLYLDYVNVWSKTDNYLCDVYFLKFYRTLSLLILIWSLKF
jgi:hypothetical protein